MGVHPLERFHEMRPNMDASEATLEAFDRDKWRQRDKACKQRILVTILSRWTTGLND